MTHKNYKALSLFLVLPMIAVIMAGCGKSVTQVTTEKMAEKAIESQTGSDANVNIKDDGVKIESKDGKIETGDNVKLPGDFPSDVFVIDGKIKSAIVDEEGDNFSITIETDKSVEEALNLYQDKLKADSWKIVTTVNTGETSSVIAEKDERNLSIMFGKSDTKTSVIISLGKK